MASTTSHDLQLQLPPAFQKGHRAAIFAPSARGVRRFPERFARSINALGHALDCEVVVPADLEVDDERLAGSGQHRARIFDELIRDPSVGAIFTTYGGFNTNDMLAHVDWETVRSNPTIVVGYSDTSALLLAIQAMTGLVTYHGPALLPQFGELPAPFAYTVRALRRAIVDGQGGEIAMPEDWCDQGEDWAVADGPRRRRAASPLASIRPGHAQGRLFGGNLSTLNFLVGTPFIRPPPEPIIFFIEMVDTEASWFNLRRSLTHLRDAGLFENVAGLVVGRSPQTGEISDLADLLLEVFADYDFPILADAPFGHTDPIATLPIGVFATIASRAGHCRIEIHGPTAVVPG
jgi:muramoyltetrapeptide carboxypeptidase